jgi:ADP-ribose pyrophosphatase YjhB (NUDIX family)
VSSQETDAAPPQRDPDPEPVPVTRVGAYAVVVADGRILLTELAGTTPAAGSWTLPGGGLDHGEAPVDAVIREVLEETGHELVEPRLVDVGSAHFVGRSPRGRLEDFHGIRIVYRGDVAAVREPEVLDVGGSTSAAAWVALDRLGDLPLAGWLLPLLSRVLDEPALAAVGGGPYGQPHERDVGHRDGQHADDERAGHAGLGPVRRRDRLDG